MPLLSQHQQRRREQVLTQHPASNSGTDIRLVLKGREVVLLCHESGDVPWDQPHTLGLYYQDGRFLDGFELTLVRAGRLDVVRARRACARNCGVSTLHSAFHPASAAAITGAAGGFDSSG
jgi:hypothetical protein